MIALTSAAAEQVRALQDGDPARAVLRVYVSEQTCCSYRYGLALDDQVDATDSVEELEGVRVAVDAQSQPYCDGATIDFVTTPDGQGFLVRGPRRAAGACACGRS